MYTKAANYNDALSKWIKFIAEENDMSPTDVEAPEGICLICDDDEFVD